jgi:hypothetical protein
MKRLATLIAPLLGVLLLANVAPVSAKLVAEPPAYKHYIACGISQNAKPAHKCPKKSKKGAFFKSLKGDVSYSVCVKFPTGKKICAKAQPASQGTLYVNKITSNILGRHRVTWFVEGKRVGVSFFSVSG